AGITQYKLTNFRGKTRLLVTANTEEAVFNALNAAARALSDPSSRGVPTTVQVVLTTSSGDSAGTLEMSPDNARLLVNGQITAAAIGILLLSFGPAVATASAGNLGRGGFHGGFGNRGGFGHHGGFGHRGGFAFRGHDRFFSGRSAPFRSFHRPFAPFGSFAH